MDDDDIARDLGFRNAQDMREDFINSLVDNTGMTREEVIEEYLVDVDYMDD